MEALESALATLRDVEGVLGSFVIDADGGLTSRDMPAVVDDEALSGAGRRVVRLRAALETTGRRVEQCSLRFGGYLLLARPGDTHTLGVLVSGAANRMALQMGSTLVARRVQSELASRPWHSPAQVKASVVPNVPPVVEPPAEAPAPTRFFRGRPV